MRRMMDNHHDPSPTDTRYALRIWTLCVLLPCLALAAIGAIACTTAHGATTIEPTDSACFPAGAWGPAPDTIRPCVTLYANAPEQGAVYYAVEDATGVVRYSGYVTTRYRHIIHVRVVRVAEDGSFTLKARSQDGRTTMRSVGNLEG